MKKLYIVTWGDSWGGPRHYEEGMDTSPMIMMDVGWVMEQSDETITLAMCHSPDTGAYRNLAIIPWVNVIKMEELI